MELELGLSLSSHDYSGGFEPKKTVGLVPWRNNEEYLFDMKKKKKRRFEEKKNDEFNGSINLNNLLLWSGNDQDDDDDDDQQKQKRFSFPLKNEEEDQIVGWPPIKSWRKKLLHHHRQQGGGGGGRVAAGNENNNMNNGSACGTNFKYVKVKMEGVGIARKINLRLFNSYQTLQNFLIRMFGDHRSENEFSSNYTLTYQDEDRDWLLAGDVPWQSFIESVQRLELHRNEGRSCKKFN